MLGECANFDNIATHTCYWCCLTFWLLFRLTAAEAMRHKWIVSQLGKPDKQRSSVSFASDRGLSFKRFMAMQKLRKAALSDIAANLTTDEIGMLGETFRQIDRDGDGTLSLKDLDEALAHRKYSRPPVDDMSCSNGL